MSNPIHFSTQGPPEVVLPPEAAPAIAALEQAEQQPPDDRRSLLESLIRANPRSLATWAALGDIGRDPVEAYAAYRVGYHRGLDSLRQNGWRGSGYVRWEHESNRGFLRALAGLARVAAEIGETDEAERCELFLRQLDPTWPPTDGSR